MLRRLLFLLLPLLTLAVPTFSQIRHDGLMLPGENNTLPKGGSIPSRGLGYIHTPHSVLRTPQSTRALVIGVSDYQSPQISDLQYARRSAEAFAAWLQSPAGGQLRSDRLHVLTDDRATLGGVTSEIDWLVETCADDDLVVVYIATQLGLRPSSATTDPYVLLYDSPQADLGAGACAVQTLAQGLLLVEKHCKGKVVLVADWMIPGEAAAASAGAASARMLTELIPTDNFAGVLSCQPMEIAWKHAAGSAGLFTQQCLEALYGLADTDQDHVIGTEEFRQYMERQAPLPLPLHWWGTAPPALALVDADYLERLLFYKSRPLEGMEASGDGASEGNLPDNLPAERVAQYHAFREAMTRGDLIDPPGYCAWDMYRQLSSEELVDRLGKRMRRELCAALQDEAQQALNALLESDPYELTNWRYNAVKYNQYPEFLRRAQELLGEKHYLSTALKAKKLYFEAYGLSHNNPDLLRSSAAAENAKQIAKAKLQEALQYQPEAAYLYQAAGYLHFGDYSLDSFLYYYNQAIELSPTWILPYIEIGQKYMHVFVDLKMAEQWYRKALDINPRSFVALEKLALLYQWHYKMTPAVETCQEMIRLRPDLPNGYATLGNIYLAVKDYPHAEQYAQKALELNPHLYSWSYSDLGVTFMRTRRYDLGFAHFEKALARPDLVAGERVTLLRRLAEAQIEIGLLQEAQAILDRHALVPIADILWEIANREVLRGKILALQGRYLEADSVLRRALTIDATPNPFYIAGYAYLGVTAAGLGRSDSAEYFFHKAIDYTTNVRFIDQMFYADAHFRLGQYLLGINRKAAAKAEFRRAMEADPGWYAGYYGMADFYARRGKKMLALDYLERALLRYYPNRAALEKEPAFDSIRSSARYADLITRSFPEK